MERRKRAVASQQLPKELQVMYLRVPQELRNELDTLPPSVVVKVLESLNKLHHSMEAEVYKLALSLIQVLR